MIKVPFYVTPACFQSWLTFFGSQISYTVCLKDSSIQKIERISVKYTQFSETTQEEENMKAAEEEEKKKKKARHISLADKTPHPLGTV